MRHGNKVNHLGRTYAHRKAMLANMANSLIEHKRIQTTLAKAKELRRYVEPLITKSKNDSTHTRRVVFAYLQNKNSVRELFTEVAPKVANRPGGYTRILKLGVRQGDNAEVALIELVDYNEYLTSSPAKSGTATADKGKKTRRRQTKKKATDAKAESSKADSAEAKPAKKTKKADKKDGE